MKKYRCPDCGDEFASINDVNGYCLNCREHFNLDEAEKRLARTSEVKVGNEFETLETIEFSAAECASMDLCGIRIAGTKTWYESVRFSRNGQRVCLSRLQQLEFPRLRQINRYVDADTKMEVNINTGLNRAVLQSFGFI